MLTLHRDAPPVTLPLIGRLCGITAAIALAGCGGGGGGGGSSPPPTSAPTVSLSASAASVTVGGSTTLTWSSTSATSCTASGGWSGARAVSGSELVGNITAATTYSLSCSGAGGTSPVSSVTVTINPPSANVTVSGKVTYARVPFSTTLGQGLNYAGVVQQPSRGIVVQILNAQTSALLATVSTNADGDYSAAVPANTNVIVRAVAQMVRDTSQPLPRWRFEVRDLPPQTEIPSALPPIYTFDSAAFSSGAGATHNVAIPSGYDARGNVTGTRHAAPFAILDTIYRAYNTILTVAPSADFTPLIIDWGVDNASGQTFFTVAPVQGQPTVRRPKIVLSAAANSDTDEYDAHVVAHEFGHYIEEYFSRADSIGGPHGPGDHLDMRLAFGEGYGYAFAAIVLDDPVARDSFTQGGQRRDSVLDVERNDVTNPGWYSEASNWAILWDLFDSANEPGDNLSLGLRPLWEVLTGPQRDTDALTSIFTFAAALKANLPAQAASIDEIVGRPTAAPRIVAPTINPFATTETNSGNPSNPNVLPIYTPITIGGPAVTVTSIGGDSGFGRGGNKLSTRRFLRLDVPNAQSVRVAVTAPNGRDADVLVLRRGVVVGRGIAVGNENFPVSLQAGTHILEVYDCENAECSDAANYNYAPTPITVTVTN